MTAQLYKLEPMKTDAITGIVTNPTMVIRPAYVFHDMKGRPVVTTNKRRAAARIRLHLRKS